MRNAPFAYAVCSILHRLVESKLYARPYGGEIFHSLKEAQIIVGEWVKHYNHIRPHSALGYRPPAPQTQVPQIIQNQPSLLQ